jgi:hypothetical protein
MIATELDNRLCTVTRQTLEEMRHKWHEVVTFENGREVIRGDVEGQKYTLRPPVVYRRQLVQGLGRQGDGGRGLDLTNNSYVFCYSGIRGSNKTKSLTFASLFSMAIGLDCRTNYPIEFILVEDSGQHIRMKPPVVTVGEMIDSLDKWLKCFICGDEWQDIVGNYDYASTKSKLVAGRTARIRKAKSSLGYTSKFVNWTSTRTRDELDLEFGCEDAANTTWGYGNFRKGEKAIWTVKDYSGVWSGKRFDEKHPKTYQYLVYMRPIHGAYDTDFSVDILESMRGVKVDLEKKLITDKASGATVNADLIRTQLIGIFEAKQKKPVYNSELWTKLGIDAYDRKNRQVVQTVMNELGIEKTQNGYRRDYLLVNS